jgi:heparin binding hemagglutinin HbhA
MNEEETPNVDEIKNRLKIDIPVEEEPAVAKDAEADIADELKNLGRQLADTLRTAWHSQERQRLESEIRRGVKSFADEVGKAVREIKDSPPAQRAREEATHIRTKVESGEMGHKAKSNMAQGLHWLSEELERLSKQFTPTEKEAEDQGE